MADFIHVTDWKASYVKLVNDRFQGIEESNFWSGRPVGIKRRYPRLRLTQAKREEDETIPYSGTLLQQAEVSRSSDRYSPSTVQDLFVPDNSGFLPTTVVLHGPAGIGKTTTCQKIMVDWATGYLYGEHFQFIFYVSCRELNQVIGNLNLPGLLSRICGLPCPDDLVKAIFSDPRKVLFVIDGFDELRWSLEEDYDEYEEPFQEVHKDTFLRCLFSKEFLKETSFLVTTRTLSLEKLKLYLQSPCSVEVLGFTEEDCLEYFHNFFEHREEADAALDTVKGNEPLFAMCAVPLLNLFVCTIMQQGFGDNLSMTQCKTVSSVYLLYVQAFIKSHDSDLDKTCLKKLRSLAVEGVLTQKSLFGEEDLKRHGLSVSELESVFQRSNIFHQDVLNANSYSFIHLSLQEFFAALYYVLGDQTESGNGSKTISVEDSPLPEVCKSKSLLDLSADHPHLTLTIRSLFGLLKEMEFTNSERIKPALEKWFTSGKPSMICIDALYCLYEMQDENFCKTVFQAEDLEFVPSSYFGAFENICTRELAYCLTNSQSHRSISMEDFIIRPTDLDVLSPLLHKSSKLSFIRCAFPADPEQRSGHISWLCHEESKIQELEFEVCVFASCFFEDLRDFLSANRTIGKLVLSHQKLPDCALKYLCEGLRQPGCTVQELILDDCNLTSASCEELGFAIKTNRSLRKLEMALNKLEDSGVGFLCEGLREPGCTVQELSLRNADLTSASCEDLRSVLMTSRSLTTLDLSDNDLQDLGVKALCHGLRHPDCVLKVLRLHESNLTSLSCKSFHSVAIGNRSLDTLDLTYNNLQDAGLKQLCYGLQYPACPLQELILCHTEITASACEDISAVILTNRRLTKLDLTWNSFLDSGVQQLSSALRDPSCVLRELHLYGCDLTSSSCGELADVITTNKSLVHLDLAGNQFQDDGVIVLCHALRDPGCTLQVARIGYCDLTPTCCDEFLSVMNTNQSLMEMEVTMSADEGEPCSDIDVLCERVKHPLCSVEKSETQDGTFVYVRYKRQK